MKKVRGVVISPRILEVSPEDDFYICIPAIEGIDVGDELEVTLPKEEYDDATDLVLLKKGNE